MAQRKTAKQTTPSKPLPDDLPDNLAPPPVEAGGFEPTDLGNADRLAAYYGDRLRYCQTHACWYVWDKCRWVEDATCRADSYAELTVRRIIREAAHEGDSRTRSRILDWAKTSQSSFRIDAMLKRARHKLALAATDLNQHPYLLNCPNGTLDLETMVFREHRRSDYLTQSIAVAYDPRATCPTWLGFLALVTDGDRALVDFLQRSCGYLLTGDVGEQCFWLCHGNGGNGKTRLIMAIMELLGDYADKTRFESLTVNRNDTVGEDIADLHGARMVYAAEPQRGARLSESRIKELCSAEPIKCRKLYGHPFTYLPQYKVWLHCNEKPRIEDPTHGMWRKVMLVPFNVRIADRVERVDIHFGKRLSAELPGILNWCLAGLRDWKAGGLAPPKTVAAATEAYRKEEDSFSAFLDACCVKAPEAATLSGELYAAFAEWSEDKTVGETVFGNRLRDAGFVKDRSTKKETAGRVVWRGIKLKEIHE